MKNEQRIPHFLDLKKSKKRDRNGSCAYEEAVIHVNFLEGVMAEMTGLTPKKMDSSTQKPRISHCIEA